MTEDTKNIKIRTVFMGTSELAQTILSVLIDEGYNIVSVYTKPDKPVGRNQEITESPIKQLAKKHGIDVIQPPRFNSDEIETLKKLKPDLIVVAAYGKILPKEVLDLPGFGCVNVHVSLLPKFRGPSPIQNALLAGETETGVTVMLMDTGVDTGHILAQEKITIEQSDTAPVLSDKLAAVGAKLLINTLPLWIDRKIEPKPQNHAEATLCQLIEREDGKIIWEDDAETIYNKFRALYEWPGIFTYWKNIDSLQRLKLCEISLQRINPQEPKTPGFVFQLGEKIGVQTLNGIIILEKIQLEGKKMLPISEFINGYPSFIGSTLS